MAVEDLSAAQLNFDPVAYGQTKFSRKLPAAFRCFFLPGGESLFVSAAEIELDLAWHTVEFCLPDPVGQGKEIIASKARRSLVVRHGFEAYIEFRK